MPTREYWVKPHDPNIETPWNKGKSSEYPGPDNFGTPDKPVFFSSWGMSDWFYDASVDTHIVHFTNPAGGVPVFDMGPARRNGDQYLPACIYIQPNPKFPNRKVSVSLIGDRNDPPILRYHGHKWTKEQVGKWQNAIEGAPIVSSPGYIERFDATDLEIDANFQNQGYAAEEGSKHRGFKLLGIQVRAQNGYVARVKVRNFGSSSDTIGNSLAAETFGINPYALEPKHGAWQILCCEVSQGRFVNGGYATAIAPCMFTAKPEPTPVEYYEPDIDSDNSTPPWWCYIKDCTVYGHPNINGTGSAGAGAYASRNIRYEDNDFIDCGIGSNNDTASVTHQAYINNRFIDCAVGIQLGAPAGGAINGKPDPKNPPFHRNYLIRDNYFRLQRSGTRLGSGSGDRVRAAGLLIRNSAAGIIFQNNVIDLCEPSRFCTWPEATDADRTFRPVLLSADDPYFPAYYGSAGPANVCIDDWTDPRRTAGTIVRAGGKILPLDRTKMATRAYSAVGERGWVLL